MPLGLTYAFVWDWTLQFLELPDPSTYADYYTIITEPRSINGVQEKLQKNRYRNILDVLNDLYLVFANALHYNEASSQISKDATVLKVKSWQFIGISQELKLACRNYLNGCGRKIHTCQMHNPRSSLAVNQASVPPLFRGCLLLLCPNGSGPHLFSRLTRWLWQLCSSSQSGSPHRP